MKRKIWLAFALSAALGAAWHFFYDWVPLPLVALAGLVWKFPFVLVFAMTGVEELAKFICGMIYLNSGKWIKPVTAPNPLPVAAEETFPAEDQAV